MYRCADGIVNWYLVEDGGELLLVDSGWPNSWSRVVAAVAQLGRRPVDLRAVLLTHGHGDHLGAAERLRREWGTPVRARRGGRPGLWARARRLVVGPGPAPASAPVEALGVRVRPTRDAARIPHPAMGGAG